MSINETLGNEQWVRENEDKIKKILPQTWTHMNNINIIHLMFQMKIVGIDWRNEEQFIDVLTFLEQIGILIRDGMSVRANPHSIFKS